MSVTEGSEQALNQQTALLRDALTRSGITLLDGETLDPKAVKRHPIPSYKKFGNLLDLLKRGPMLEQDAHAELFPEIGGDESRTEVKNLRDQLDSYLGKSPIGVMRVGVSGINGANTKALFLGLREEADRVEQLKVVNVTNNPADYLRTAADEKTSEKSIYDPGLRMIRFLLGRPEYPTLRVLEVFGDLTSSVEYSPAQAAFVTTDALLRARKMALGGSLDSEVQRTFEQIKNKARGRTFEEVLRDVTFRFYVPEEVQHAVFDSRSFAKVIARAPSPLTIDRATVPASPVTEGYIGVEVNTNGEKMDVSESKPPPRPPLRDSQPPKPKSREESNKPSIVVAPEPVEPEPLHPTIVTTPLLSPPQMDSNPRVGVGEVAALRSREERLRREYEVRRDALEVFLASRQGGVDLVTKLLEGQVSPDKNVSAEVARLLIQARNELLQSIRTRTATSEDREAWEKYYEVTTRPGGISNFEGEVKSVFGLGRRRIYEGSQPDNQSQRQNQELMEGKGNLDQLFKEVSRQRREVIATPIPHGLNGGVNGSSYTNGHERGSAGFRLEDLVDQARAYLEQQTLSSEDGITGGLASSLGFPIKSLQRAAEIYHVKLNPELAVPEHVLVLGRVLARAGRSLEGEAYEDTIKQLARQIKSGKAIDVA